VERAPEDFVCDGVQVVEVKTLDASAGYEPCIATRSFWEARGFVQIECIDQLPGWQPGNPSGIYVAVAPRHAEPWVREVAMHPRRGRAAG
jgi:hypothetical protein